MLTEERARAIDGEARDSKVGWGGKRKLRVGAMNKQRVVGGYCNGLGPTLVPRRTDGLARYSCRLQVTGCRLQVAGYILYITDFRELASCV